MAFPSFWTAMERLERCCALLVESIICPCLRVMPKSDPWICRDRLIVGTKISPLLEFISQRRWDCPNSSLPFHNVFVMDTDIKMIHFLSKRVVTEHLGYPPILGSWIPVVLHYLKATQILRNLWDILVIFTWTAISNFIKYPLEQNNNSEVKSLSAYA